MIEPEYEQSLDLLYQRWSRCTQCELGQRREEVGGSFVFGEGFHRGIMFVGEGPGATEEQEGRPFVGKSGEILRNAIISLNLDNYYITNVVSCRSVEQLFNSEGQPVFRKNRRTGEQIPILKDRAPSPAQAAKCFQRLCGEIYHADPILIVALGLEAAKTLSSVRVTSLSDAKENTKEAHIPGMFCVPSRTAVRGMWERKVKGQIVRPTDRWMVRYQLIPTYHPAYIQRFQKDRKPRNPVEVFSNDLKIASMIYDRYMLMAHQVIPSERELNPDLLREVM